MIGIHVSPSSNLAGRQGVPPTAYRASFETSAMCADCLRNALKLPSLREVSPGPREQSLEALH
jgi:hypothetical protein